MTNDTRDEALRALLREGDPAADGREPSAEEIARLRARLLDAARSPVGDERRAAVIHPHCAPDPAETRTRWTPAAVAFAALFAVLVLGAVTLRIVRPAPPGTGRAGMEAGATGEVPADEPRQIQFTTPGGTRVVWMLYPEDPESDSRAARGPGGRS
jgi:hypothetical protein